MALFDTTARELLQFGRPTLGAAAEFDPQAAALANGWAELTLFSDALGLVIIPIEYNTSKATGAVSAEISGPLAFDLSAACVVDELAAETSRGHCVPATAAAIRFEMLEALRRAFGDDLLKIAPDELAAAVSATL